MESIRQSKVGRLLQKELSEIFQREIPQWTKSKMVTVTIVRVSPDLGYAKGYLSVFPSTDADKLVEEINEHTGEIRHLLIQRVRKQLRKMPELRFYLDDSLDYAERIDELLQ